MSSVVDFGQNGLIGGVDLITWDSEGRYDIGFGVRLPWQTVFLPCRLAMDVDASSLHLLRNSLQSAAHSRAAFPSGSYSAAFDPLRSAWL